MKIVDFYKMSLIFLLKIFLALTLKIYKIIAISIQNRNTKCS